MKKRAASASLGHLWASLITGCIMHADKHNYAWQACKTRRVHFPMHAMRRHIRLYGIHGGCRMRYTGTVHDEKKCPRALTAKPRALMAHAWAFIAQTHVTRRAASCMCASFVPPSCRHLSYLRLLQQSIVYLQSVLVLRLEATVKLLQTPGPGIAPGAACNTTHE